jgi:Fur family zinc uptake transcriptional regulator
MEGCLAGRGEERQTDVLAALQHHGRPRSAYQILADLRRSEPKLSPPTVCRALAALIERGCVHRLESLNKFMACGCDHHRQAYILSICGDCSTVEESAAPDLPNVLSRIVGQSGFRPARHVIEVHGRCGACSATETEMSA